MFIVIIQACLDWTNFTFPVSKWEEVQSHCSTVSSALPAVLYQLARAGPPPHLMMMSYCNIVNTPNSAQLIDTLFQEISEYIHEEKMDQSYNQLIIYLFHHLVKEIYLTFWMYIHMSEIYFKNKKYIAWSIAFIYSELTIQFW